MARACPSCGKIAGDPQDLCAACGALLSDPQSDPWLGKVVGGRYRLVARIGAGGMGAVYRAEHTMMKKELAVKFLHPELGRMEEISRRFLREAEAASRLDHPGCIKVTDFGRTDDGALFLVMEYLDGQSLTSAIAGTPMPPPRAVYIARQIAEALAHAHAQGIVHRDLKPDNIMLVTRDGRPDLVRILDFGIAKLTQGGASGTAGETLTQAGVVFGTPEYLSPEQALGEEADGRADLYACGVILFEMLAGRRPFDAPNKVAILSMHLTQAPPRPSELLPPGALPAALDEICLRLLAKRREDRFASADELVDALLALGLPEPARPRTSHSTSAVAAQAAIATPAAGAVAAGASAAVVAYEPTRALATPPGVVMARGGAAAAVATATAGANGAPTHARSPDRPAGIMVARARAWLLPPVLASEGPWWRTQRARRLGLVTASAFFAFVLLGLALRGGRPRGGGRGARGAPALAPVPLDLAIKLREAESRIQGGDHAGARLELAQIERKWPRDGRAHYLSGSLSLADGDKSGGLAEIGDAIDLDPGYRDDPALIAQVTALLGDPAVGQAALSLLADKVGAPALPTLVDLASHSRNAVERREARKAVDKLDAGDRIDRVSSFGLDLEQGKTCAERRQAVADLRALGDKRAVPVLQAARNRTGGFLGLDHPNACIQADIDDALRYLDALP